MNLKSQKGSITLFVLVSCLFFLASVACVNMYMQSKQVAVDREYRQIKANYEKDINNMETIYHDLASKNNLSVQFGVPEIDKENKKINVSVFTNLEYLNINTIKYGWDYGNDLSLLSNENISNWTYVEHQNGENEFIASIDFKKDTNENDIVYYYLSVVVDNKEFGTTVSYYVDDGMILHYDGINNVGLGDKKHSLNATTWKNLCENVSGHDGVLSTTGITWGNDYLNFDGNDWVNAGQINNTSRTMEVVYSVSSLAGSTKSIFGNWGNSEGGILLRNNLISGGYVINGRGENFTDKKTINVGTKYSFTISYDGDILTCYINGNNVFEQSIEGTITNGGSVMALGVKPSGNSASGGYLKGKIYSARIYSGGLTADEVKQNYITDKSRFNIED